MSERDRSTVYRLGDGRTSRPIRGLLRLVERSLGLDQLSRVYERLPVCASTHDFLEAALNDLRVGVAVDNADTDRIPESGPTLVASNHPFGGIEGMALPHLLMSIRPDVKVLANYVLGRMPEFDDLFILVDPFGGRDAAARSLSGMRQALEWLDAGGLLLVFPAGEVAHLNLRERRVADPPWNPVLGRLARRSAATVVPTFIAGRNGWPFQMLGLIHPGLRTLMLPRQLLAVRGTTLDVRFGSPIRAQEIDSDADDRSVTSWLRSRSEILAERSSSILARHDPVQPRKTPSRAEPVVGAVPPDELEKEIRHLPQNQLLVENGNQLVLEAGADQIPKVLREIGRLRELSFREVGEGTGREIDLDEFDHSYRHLFIWNRDAREVVGAYRMGLSDLVLGERGIGGLYTSTLFRFSPKLFDEMGPALEMGRSFIRAEYQRSFAGLMLLWKGIGQYVMRHPRYTVLFGPVSISADYRAASQQLIASFLSQNNLVHDGSHWVRPRSPYRPRRSPVVRHAISDLSSVEEVSRYVAEIEADGRGVPILLKQYLKLGGRLLGFNVDPDFSNVLDVLIMVDLKQTEPRILARYMGEKGAEEFLRGASGDEVGGLSEAG